jgi:DNA-binding LytR/AlgR family response regulator
MTHISVPIYVAALKINRKTDKFVWVDDVVMLRGAVNYSTVYLQNGKQIMIAHTLKYFEDILQDYGFLRVHRAYLINPKHLLGYDRENQKLFLSQGLSADVSRRRAKNLKILNGEGVA